MTESLASKACIPCRGGIPPLTREEAELFHAPGNFSQTANWPPTQEEQAKAPGEQGRLSIIAGHYICPSLFLVGTVAPVFGLTRCTPVQAKHVSDCWGAARDVVGIRRGAISGNMKVSFQAARSIG